MDSNWSEIIAKLSGDSEYRKAFAAIYGDAITAAAMKEAIASFERTLITPNARFDQFLRGIEDAITEEEKQGYLLFKSYGCASCHQGRAVGGNMFEKMGVVRNYFAERGNITASDYGRFNITGVEEHRFEFKVPSLRNVELTAPYFHDGSAKTLEDAVKIMSKYQLGRQMPQEHRDLIVAFLKTLTGTLSEAGR
jgi:cytochrome c peroxidase